MNYYNFNDGRSSGSASNKDELLYKHQKCTTSKKTNTRRERRTMRVIKDTRQRSEREFNAILRKTMEEPRKLRRQIAINKLQTDPRELYNFEQPELRTKRLYLGDDIKVDVACWSSGPSARRSLCFDEHTPGTSSSHESVQNHPWDGYNDI